MNASKSGRGSISGGAEPVLARLQVNPAGYAFAVRVDGEGSIFIPPGRCGVALDGDEVMVRYWAAERGDEGVIEAVTRRRRRRITGMLRQAGRSMVLEPDDPRILGIAEVDVDASEGPLRDDVVVAATILRYPEPQRLEMRVAVERVLGPPDALGTEQAKILIEYGIDPEFPPEVVAEAEAMPTEVRPEDFVGRDDLRDLDFMTIDPEDARDFDDAVCVELLGSDENLDEMMIHVAVADVAHYVREGSAIDTEAIWRSFSAYLPHRAVPMLPERLSSHMCSLVPRQDRCAMVVSMRVLADGEVAQVLVRAAIIHSRERLTYGDVAGELASRDNLPPPVAARVHLLRRAADRLRARRLHRGAVELNLPEIRVVLDEDDPSRIRDIVPSRASREMSRAYNLIEELMVAANEAIGAIAGDERLPIVYRVHAPPDEDRLAQLAEAAEVLGVRVEPERLTTPRGVQTFLGRVKAHARATSLNVLTLRSMAQAEYRTENLGHFALASDAYVHFTSPIRRYPDVIAHRVMKAWLKRHGGKAGPPPVPKMPERQASIDEAQRASLREREIVAAERESKSLFAAAFMRERIGDRFEGSITGMSSAGVFVAIEHPFVDGMIRTASLERDQGDAFELDACNVKLTGRRSGFCLTLGDRVVVEVVDANIQRRRIEFVLVSRLT